MAAGARQAGMAPVGFKGVAGIAALTGLAIGALLFAAGYVWFALSLSRVEPRLTVRAEGIVVFTGGSDRVQEAAELLARGQAKRMLITGVNRGTRSSVLARLLPVSHKLFDCCVDLGYQAQDTIGNARETREWARTRNISHSLIVVTSNYHMPRALAELSAELPDMTLHPFPVVSDHVNVDGWASDAGVIRLVGGEYLKYLGALARITLRQNENSPDLTGLRPEPASP
ncbi:YdcF family protein [Methylocystis sp. MJC1]|uniref:YdcF family protein n=1 Tax=Methylocystis sp. MJC1 TaxID=2654282 RepID=UPI001FEF7C2D|nr:YdcF family protein [Methylocystis sp. MJC1]KAF2991719.1 hypothetical protein MJC1_01284 [Methylocystis sp. MJC1]UZX13479.1 YdcF family protein [Methylocystis sp. MJC1]